MEVRGRKKYHKGLLGKEEAFGESEVLLYFDLKET